MFGLGISLAQAGLSPATHYLLHEWLDCCHVYSHPDLESALLDTGLCLLMRVVYAPFSHSFNHPSLSTL